MWLRAPHLGAIIPHMAKTPAERVKNLTPREKEFVYQITRTDKDKPNSITEAYRRSYTAGGNPDVVRNSASMVRNKPHIREAILKVEAKIEKDRSRNRRASAAAIETALWVEAEEAITSRDRISALKALSKLIPPNAGQENPLEGSATSKEESLDKLRSLLESSLGDTTIDITPEDEPAEDLDDPHDVTDSEIVLVEAEVLEPEREPDF